MDIKNLIRATKWLWERWDVRGLMLLSLSLQTLLLLLAPLRKRTSNNWVISFILCLYLLADWAANFAAGVITSSESSINNHKNNQPLAFWSTFLLVHLGGPDSITAFAIQDNDFWHRHALALIFQCVSASYIFFQTLRQNQLWLPTVLMFVCGFIKYFERTRSLYSASFDNLRDSMRKSPEAGPDYAKMMDFYRAMGEAGLPTWIETIPEHARPLSLKEGKLRKSEVVPYAYYFFSTFKRLVVDLKCNYYKRIKSREFFLSRTAEDAFSIIAVELNLMYDILFTKANFVYTRKGFLLRLFSSALMVTAFGLFYYEEKSFRPSDVAITYALLGGVIALEVIAFIKLFTSHWFTAFTSDANSLTYLPKPSSEEPKGPKPPEQGMFRKLRKFISKRWSESVSTHNLIDYCLDLPQPEAQKIMDCFGLTKFFNGMWYVKCNKFTPELRDHIFEEVKSRSEFVEGSEILEEAITARGGFSLYLSGDYRSLYEYVDGMDYDQSLLSWHIATELCWCNDKKEEGKISEVHSNYREISKLLSEYMLYLVVMQPAIMHGVTDLGQTRLRDTCAEIQKIVYKKREKKPCLPRVIMFALKGCCRYLFLFVIGLLSPIFCFVLSLFAIIFPPLLPRAQRYTDAVLRFFTRDQTKESIDKQKIVSFILGVNTEIEPVCLKGDKSKSVLYDGCRLAQQLNKLEDNRKWEIMSNVWVEMLTYAAVRCRPQALAGQLSKGGELISFVWLLMAHFGLVDQFEDYNARGRAKLIVKM